MAKNIVMNKDIVRIEWLYSTELHYHYFHMMGLREMAEIVDATIDYILKRRKK